MQEVSVSEIQLPFETKPAIGVTPATTESDASLEIGEILGEIFGHSPAPCFTASQLPSDGRFA